MKKTLFAGMESTQNLMGKSARTRTNSTDGRPALAARHYEIVG